MRPAPHPAPLLLFPYVSDNGNLDTDNKTVDKLIRSYLKEKGFQRVVVGRGLQVRRE